MKVVIMGCGRVGGRLAGILDAEGHQVTIIDKDAYSFRRLPSGFQGTPLIGDGLSEASLVKAGIKGADVFVAVTQGDNRNVMACQIASHIFNVKKVVCRIYDPIREEMYHSLGLETISPTKIGAQLIKDLITG